MTAPAPLTSTTFADGELTNEVKWYTRVFTVINWLLGVNQDTGWLSDKSIFTAGSGVTIGTCAYRKVGSVVTLFVNVTMPAVAASSSGNVSNVVIFTITDPRFVPSAGDQGLTSVATGQLAGFYVNSSGAVVIASTVPNVAIASGSAMGIGGTYLAG